MTLPSGPSRSALCAALESVDEDDAVSALQAAHDPALGLDRSVCLRDVVNALTNFGLASADHICYVLGESA